MKIKTLAFAAILAVLGQAQAGFEVNGYAYMSAAGAEPWNSNSNLAAMDAAFGAGKWDRLNFGDDIDSYVMVYVDGGGAAGLGFASYIDSNRSALESYVLGGGHLFLNAATSAFSGQTRVLLFGATTTGLSSLHYSGAGQTTAAGLPLSANGAGNLWSGASFAQNTLNTPADFTTFITGDTQQTVLAGGAFGDGYLLLGGQTSTDSYALMLSGLAALATLARRRQPAR